MTSSEDQAKYAIARKYADCYETLTPATIDDLRDLISADFRFEDPFVSLTGPDQVCRYLGKMFGETEHPAFKVTHIAIDGDLAFLRWQFSARIAVIGDWKVTGMSALTFTPDNSKIASHVDHWDASQAFYAKLPILGWVIRRLARRMNPS
jgi:predicted SnoaL-like aldol condensation-catalyzing enzyme